MPANRITTSGRAENLDITVTVWVNRRRGSAAGNDADGTALKRLADGKTRVGETLFNQRINLYSDPKHADLPAVPATDEGVPATRLSLVSRGVLENLQYSRFWARERKREPTAGPVNYIMESTDPPVPVDAMIKTMKRGLLISRFWYVRLVDPRTIALTGLTRDGLWWIENGEVRHPVRNPPLQSERAGDARPVERRGHRAVAAAVAVHGAPAQAGGVHLHVDVRRDLRIGSV